MRHDDSGTLDLGECPDCGSMQSIHVYGYWKARKEAVYICLFSKDGSPENVCRYAWLKSEPRARCPCNALRAMRMEWRDKEYIYICDTCNSMGYDTRQGGPPTDVTSQ